jgi:hypothetical protein
MTPVDKLFPTPLSPTHDSEALRIITELVKAVMSGAQPRQLRPGLKRLDELLGRRDEVP